MKNVDFDNYSISIFNIIYCKNIFNIYQIKIVYISNPSKLNNAYTTLIHCSKK